MLGRHDLKEFRRRLLDWYRQSRRSLPWRGSKNPYRIWVSEIMLQQTRAAAVIPFYERFLERFPNIAALAAAPEDEILRYWSGLGYYSRARNLQKAAQQIVAKHQGEFPSQPEEISALAGIGAYTTAAILSIAFDKEFAVLDGNVARVLARLGALRGDLRASKRWQELETRAQAMLDPRTPGDWNQAMMELGATLCTPKSPRCLICPVTRFCESQRLGLAESLPEKRKKTATVEVTLAAAIFADRDGRTLLLPPQRGRTDNLRTEFDPALVSRMWHFPAIPAAEDSPGILSDYLRKLVPRKSWRKFSLAPLRSVRHSVTYHAIKVKPFSIAVKQLPLVAGARPVQLSDISSLPVSNLTRKVAAVALASSRRR